MRKSVSKICSNPLWPYDRAIQPAIVAPAAPRSLVRELRCHPLINVDAQSGFVVGVHVSASNFGRAGEYLAERRGEQVLLLNTEVITGQIEMHVDGMAYG